MTHASSALIREVASECATRDADTDENTNTGRAYARGYVAACEWFGRLLAARLPDVELEAALLALPGATREQAAQILEDAGGAMAAV
jgi:hypothetical protein